MADFLAIFLKTDDTFYVVIVFDDAQESLYSFKIAVDLIYSGENLGHLLVELCKLVSEDVCAATEYKCAC